MNGSLFEVSQVHGDLRQATHQKSRAFHEAQSAARKAHGLRDFLRDLNLGRVEKNVVGDQGLAGSDHGCTG